MYDHRFDHSDYRQIKYKKIYTENINSSKKSVLFDKLWLVMHLNFWLFKKIKFENVFTMLDELFLAFQIFIMT